QIQVRFLARPLSNIHLIFPYKGPQAITPIIGFRNFNQVISKTHFDMGVIVKYRAFTMTIQHGGNEYIGKITPIARANQSDNIPSEFSVILNGIFRGIFTLEHSKWQSTSLEDDFLVNAIGHKIMSYYD
ncbi:MAG: hypothetical protein LH478_01435, partial [Chitinophagaceae bacterium]|nr:hypothetical protein [Chitinophagaceae bacterium]